MTNLASPLPRLLAPSLLVLLMGCSSTAIVGTEDEPLPGGIS